MNVRHFLLLMLLMPAIAWAQGPYVSEPNGRFEVDEIRGCAPFLLTITNTDLTAIQCNNNCLISWGDGTSNPASDGVFSHTYLNPGTYTLNINYEGAQCCDEIEVTVFPNIQPAFEVYMCSGNDAQIRVTDTNYDSYIIDYGDGTEVEIPQGSSPVTHTFGASGIISVTGKNSNSADNCTPAERTIIVPLPAFTHLINNLVITNSSTIDLGLTTQQNVLYRLEIAVNGGTFQNLGNFLNVSTASVPGLNTDNNFYCFRLGKINPCAGGVPVYSPVICSADLAVTAQNNANSLTWVTSTTDVINFIINKDGTPLPPTTLTTFLDTDVVCGTAYCYQIITNYADGTSFSTVRCVSAISNNVPTALDEVTSVVNENSVTLTWQADATFPAETYSVFRQASGGPFNQVESGITIPTYTDEDYAVANQYCYRVDYIDNCGNTSNPGIVACPIVLSYTANANNDIVLNWNAYTGWASGVQQYELAKYDLQHSLLETFPLGNVTTYTDTDLTDQGYYYIVRAIPNDSDNGEAVSNEINAVRSLRFAYPKAFTPDSQGPVENETFKVFATEEFIATFEMKIFNRWGEMIFSTTDLFKGWDGRFNGTPQPEGTYTFTATLRDKTGRTFKRDGSVVLLRKK